MTIVALIICLLVGAVAASGVVFPSRLLEALRKAQTPGGLILLGVLRLFSGVAFLLAASSSKAPGLLAIVGVIAILKGVTLPLIGVDRVRTRPQAPRPVVGNGVSGPPWVGSPCRGNQSRVGICGLPLRDPGPKNKREATPPAGLSNFGGDSEDFDGSLRSLNWWV
jgi:hypothetical protein